MLSSLTDHNFCKPALWMFPVDCLLTKAGQESCIYRIFSIVADLQWPCMEVVTHRVARQ